MKGVCADPLSAAMTGKAPKTDASFSIQYEHPETRHLALEVVIICALSCVQVSVVFLLLGEREVTFPHMPS